MTIHTGEFFGTRKDILNPSMRCSKAEEISKVTIRANVVMLIWRSFSTAVSSKLKPYFI